MQDEKSFVNTLILGVCMLVSLVLVGHMLLSPKRKTEPLPEPFVEQGTQQQSEIPQETTVGISISNVQLSDMLANAAPITIENLTASIRKDGTVALQGTVSKNAIEKLVESGTQRTMLMFLPDTCDFALSLKLGMTEGTVTASNIQASVAGVELPEQMITPFATAMVNQINEKLLEMEIGIDSIQFKDNSMTVKSS